MNKERITFTIPGNPNALKRHRHFRRGNFTQTYDPSKGDKADFLSIAMNNRPKKPFNCPLYVLFEFQFQRPQSHYRTGKYADQLKPNAPTWHTKTPDTDNLIKFVCDSLNGIFWKDDSCICQIRAVKFYSNTPSTVIQIRRTQN